MLYTKVLALFAALSATTLADDVYSTFYDSNGEEVGGDNFDVSNTGCFNVPNAKEVEFTQAAHTSSTAQGPYCLSAFSDECTTLLQSQQFSDVSLDGQMYSLNQEDAAAYSWAPNAC